MIVVTPEFGTLVIRFRYNPQIVAEVRSVPGARWHPEHRYWAVPDYMGSALRLALVQWDEQVVWSGMPKPSLPYFDFDFDDEDEDEEPRRAHVSDWATALFDAVGPARREPVFRALSKVLHPDAGGDSELMRALLEARGRAS